MFARFASIEGRRLFLQDTLLILIMATLAACGLIYQYLLSHYAGRVLGIMEHAIYTMIGVMIVSMGLGAFIARGFKCAVSAFAWLEVSIALLGSCGILIVGGAFAFAFLFPEIISRTFFASESLPVVNVSYLIAIAEVTPYLIGGLIAVMIGMEIPFIARIREELYGRHLGHNVGTIYGADYIGAGVGAAIFILYMLRLEPSEAAVYTASVNLCTGVIFLVWYFKEIKLGKLLLLVHGAVLAVLLVVSLYGTGWSHALESMLYEDAVILSEDTPYQHITVTKRRVSPHTPPVYTLFLNGRTQFSSEDEHIYHEFLVHPGVLASARHDDVLIIGGGDGLALRNLLEWEPRRVTLMDLDEGVVRLFRDPFNKGGGAVNQPLLALNKNSLRDPRLNLVFADAYNGVDEFIAKKHRFDTIIVDLPDPSHPDLNKLYSVSFYKKMRHILAGDGAIVVQSTSPYHAKRAFVTVGLTMREAGFKNVERYHHNVPSFGEWGWTIATPIGQGPLARIKSRSKSLPADSWATHELIEAAFVFARDYFAIEDTLEPNRLGNHLMYFLHQEAWLDDEGR